MFSATFIFEKKQLDERFHWLDEEIATFARHTTGYAGEEAWENPQNGRICTVYYWTEMTGLHELMQHPKHLEAKAAQGAWLNGYQVVISQVVRAYNDNTLEHPLKDWKVD